MIQIYNPNNTDYTQNGDLVLMPSSATVHPILNGAWEAELTHPIDPEGRWKSITEESVIKMPSFNGEQLFRIKDVQRQDSGVTAIMEPIFYDSMNDCWLTDIRPTSDNGQQALTLMLSPNNKYSGSSNITKVSTAYYEYRNFMEALNGDIDQSFIKRWGGEILYDNYTVIVNERVGGDYGIELRYGKNIPQDGMSIEIDIRDVITRIYPKGYNGVKMSGSGYVDSVNINKYPISKTTTITYENIKLRSDLEGDPGENDIICDNQDELDAALAEACIAEYDAGLDKPKVTISADMVLLQNTEQYKDIKILETVSLGDTVHCRNTYLDIVSDARVIELEYDSIHKKVTSVVLGDYQYKYFDNITSASESIGAILNPDGTVMAERVQGILNGIYTQLRLQSTAAQKVDGAAFKVEELDESSPLYGCMIWGTQGIQISTTRTADGRDWDWTTAITANGIVANAIVTGLLSDKTGNNYWDLDTGEFRLAATATVGGQHIATADVTIKKVDVEYAAGDSNTEAPTDGWSTDSPQWEPGKYIWQRTVTTMANNNQVVSDPVCIQGAAGEGAVTIESNTVTYAVGDSGVTPPDEWTENVPDVQPGQYLWSKSETAYSDGTTSVSYGVSYQGENGTSGTDGNGITSSTVTYQVSDSGTTPPSGEWSDTVPDMEPGQFLWTRTQFTYTDGDVTTSYSVSYQGENGSQGVPGPPGEDGQTLYTWIKYADTPTSGMSDSPDGKKYLGIAYNKESPIESDNYEDYQWADIKGKDGIPGAPGENGETLYTWIKYATDASGSGMSDSPEGCSYIGIAYNKESPEESDSPADYAWSLIQGEAGIGVENVVEEYYLSTSSTEQTDGEWSTDQPEWVKGRYIWTRSKVTWTDGSITYTDPVLAKAINGANEAVGDLDDSLDQEGVFNRLTNNGQTQGIYLENGILYINASYIASGTLKGNLIDARNLVVKDNSGNTTFAVDANGNVTIRATSFTLQGNTIAEIVDDALSNYNPADDLSQEELFDILTNNGATDGIYLRNGQIYINATFIDTGNLAGWIIDRANRKIYCSANTVFGLTTITFDAGNGEITVVNNSTGISTTIDHYGVKSTSIHGDTVWAKALNIGNDGSSAVITDKTATFFIPIYADNIQSSGTISFSGTVRLSGTTTLSGTVEVNTSPQFNRETYFNNYVTITNPTTNSNSPYVRMGGVGRLFKDTSSSRRYKDHIGDMEAEEAEKLYSLPVVLFKYKEGYLPPEDQRYKATVPGFYAEDMAEYIPIAADYGDIDGESLPENWNDRYLIPYMVKCIQEQHKEIEILKRNQEKILQALASAGIEV